MHYNYFAPMPPGGNQSDAAGDATPVKTMCAVSLHEFL